MYFRIPTYFIPPPPLAYQLFKKEIQISQISVRLLSVHTGWDMQMRAGNIFVAYTTRGNC